MLAEQQVAPDRIRPLRRVDYEALVERGLLEDSRVELLLGALVDMTPQGPLHAEVVRRIAERLTAPSSTRVHVRVHSPLALSDDSVPEPDIAVVPAADYTTAHPRHALLLVEVADTSLSKDRGVKAALYATAGIPEFWVVNLVDRVVEIHRHPEAGRYNEVHRVTPGGVCAPAGLPECSVRVDEILPA